MPRRQTARDGGGTRAVSTIEITLKSAPATGTAVAEEVVEETLSE